MAKYLEKSLKFMKFGPKWRKGYLPFLAAKHSSTPALVLCLSVRLSENWNSLKIQAVTGKLSSAVTGKLSSAVTGKVSSAVTGKLSSAKLSYASCYQLSCHIQAVISCLGQQAVISCYSKLSPAFTSKLSWIGNLLSSLRLSFTCSFSGIIQNTNTL